MWPVFLAFQGKDVSMQSLDLGKSGNLQMVGGRMGGGRCKV